MDISAYDVKGSGIIGLTPNATQFEDNPHYFTNIYHWLLALNGQEDLPRADKYEQWLADCEVVKGLYKRRPDLPLEERAISHDEMIGICTWNYIDAIWIKQYAEEHFWIFSQKFAIKQWLWRFPAFVGYVDYRCHGSTSLLVQLLWAINIWRVSRGEWGDTSSKCLHAFISMNLGQDCPKLIRKAYDYFWRRIAKDYGDLSGLYAIYFGKTHPFVEMSKAVKYG